MSTWVLVNTGDPHPFPWDQLSAERKDDSTRFESYSWICLETGAMIALTNRGSWQADSGRLDLIYRSPEGVFLDISENVLGSQRAWDEHILGKVQSEENRVEAFAEKVHGPCVDIVCNLLGVVR